MMDAEPFWRGVLPAITTPFTAEGDIDHEFMALHARRMAEAGCIGMVPLDTLGETSTLGFEEKCSVMRTLVAALEVPVIPGIAARSTATAVRLAREAEALGCRGLMILPAEGCCTDRREASAHVRAVLSATELPCALCNQPTLYGNDFLPAQIAELAFAHPNLQAVKEASSDVRRITTLRHLLGDRLELLVGTDDLIVEAMTAGADGWVAGLVNAFPEESVHLFEQARDGRSVAAESLHRWFLPLLRLNTGPRCVQQVKLVQKQANLGGERVRAPRLPLEGNERVHALQQIRHALATRKASPD